MKMKKILALCIAALMTLEAAGCGAGSSAPGSAVNNKDESAVSSEAAAITDESIPSEEETAGSDDVKLSDDASDFVLLSEAVPDAILEIRYYSTYNFIGDRVDGYEEPLAFLTKEAAAALREAMISHGFKPLVEEWWHFTLENEPYPDTYFTFPINSDSLAEAS